MELTLEQNNANERLWGEDLFYVFHSHIDHLGWLTSDWARIVEQEVPRFDKDYNDNPMYTETYSKMYSLDFEGNEDESKIRPLNN